MSSKSSLHILKGELLQFFRKINKSSDSELIIAIFSELISSEEILYRYYTNSYGRIVKVINLNKDNKSILVIINCIKELDKSGIVLSKSNIFYISSLIILGMYNIKSTDKITIIDWSFISNRSELFKCFNTIFYYLRYLIYLDIEIAEYEIINMFNFIYFIINYVLDNCNLDFEKYNDYLIKIKKNMYIILFNNLQDTEKINTINLQNIIYYLLCDLQNATTLTEIKLHYINDPIIINCFKLIPCFLSKSYIRFCFISAVIRITNAK